MTKIINLYCEGMILHVHKDKTDEMNLQLLQETFVSENIDKTFLDNSNKLKRYPKLEIKRRYQI